MRRATIVESYASLDDSDYFTNSVTEIMLKNNAALEHIKIIDESPQANHIGHTQVQLGAQADYRSHVFALQGGLLRSDIDISFAGEHSQCQLNGLFMPNDDQHFDHHTTISHNSKSCQSREYYKGILRGTARGVFNGKVIVAKHAENSDAELYNYNLLLSKQAEVNTKPELEIYNDNVKCCHGATVGCLDEEAVILFAGTRYR